jgi:hypothetical protein
MMKNEQPKLKQQRDGMSKDATKQAYNPADSLPVDKQFGKPNGNPRHNGAWKKEDTPRYKLERMEKLSEDELQAIYDDREAPLFERRLAQAIIGGDWKTIESIINQVYGQPKNQTDITTNGKDISPLLVKFIGDDKE